VPQQQAAAPLSREEHNKALAEAFSDPAAVQQSLQPLDSHAQLASGLHPLAFLGWCILQAHSIHVQTSMKQELPALCYECDVAVQRLERIVEEVPNLGPASRVIIVGCGTGALIPSLQVYLRAQPRTIGAVQVFRGDVVPSQLAFDEGASLQSGTQLPDDGASAAPHTRRATMPQVTQMAKLCCAICQELGVRDILAVDLAQPMLDALTQRFSPPSTLGDQPGVSFFQGSFVTHVCLPLAGSNGCFDAHASRPVCMLHDVGC
jgi:hypothetical protein